MPGRSRRATLCRLEAASEGKVIGRKGVVGVPAVIVAAMALAAPAAWAGVAASGNGVLLVGENNANEKNALVAYELNGKFRVGEVFIAMAASTGCQAAGAKDVDCDIFQVDSALIQLGGNDDTVGYGIDLPAVILGGDGIDAINGGPRDDGLEGDRGNDQLYGGGGDDTLSDGGGLFGADGDDLFSGDNGDDLLQGGVPADTGKGADSFYGGGGTDTLDYSQRTAPLTVTEGDGHANDGEAGEHDEVFDVERMLLGPAGDHATGAGGPNVLEGGAGGDSLAGGGGPDQLLGGPGDDDLDGGPGRDSLSGGPGTDSVSYASRTQPVSVGIDDGANDGQSGERDDVQLDGETV